MGACASQLVWVPNRLLRAYPWRSRDRAGEISNLRVVIGCAQLPAWLTSIMLCVSSVTRGCCSLNASRWSLNSVRSVGNASFCREGGRTRLSLVTQSFSQSGEQQAPGCCLPLGQADLCRLTRCDAAIHFLFVHALPTEFPISHATGARAGAGEQV